MSMKFNENEIIVKLNYKGVDYNKRFETKEEMDKWFQSIIGE